MLALAMELLRASEQFLGRGSRLNSPQEPLVVLHPVSSGFFNTWHKIEYCFKLCLDVLIRVKTVLRDSQSRLLSFDFCFKPACFLLLFQTESNGIHFRAGLDSFDCIGGRDVDN
jgi:hypothetical protein